MKSVFLGLGIGLAGVAVALLVFAHNDRTTIANPAPSIIATAEAPLLVCEAKKRAFVEQIPTMLQSRQPPAGMFVTIGSFLITSGGDGVVQMEGNGLQAMVHFDRAFREIEHAVACI